MTKIFTCQICGRDIKKLKDGRLAHHGYTRPGYGWQTASCFGARELPYEESRDVLPLAIEANEEAIAYNNKRTQELHENPPAELTTRPRWIGHRTQTYKRPEGFDASKAHEIARLVHDMREDHVRGATDEDINYAQTFQGLIRSLEQENKMRAYEADTLKDRYHRQPEYVAKLAEYEKKKMKEAV